MGSRQRDAQALGKAKNDNKAERIEAREGNLVNLATSMPSETDAVALPPPHELPEQPVCGKTTGLKDRERVREGGAVRCSFLHTLAGPAAKQPSGPVRAGFCLQTPNISQKTNFATVVIYMYLHIFIVMFHTSKSTSYRKES